MGSLVKEFRRDIVRSPKSTTELLRTAKVISVKLGLTDITEWINCELTGYARGANIPAYRCLSGGMLMFLNPSRGWLPAGELRTTFKACQPVSELEALSISEPIVCSLPQDANYPIRGELGWDLSRWHQQIQFSAVQLKGLLSAIKDKLLDWSLELEQRGIMGEDMSFLEKERQSAHNQTFHIQNFIGVVGDVSQSSLQIYDYCSVHQTLTQLSIPQPERNELENIMDELKRADTEKKKSLLERAKAWIVRNEAFLGAAVSIVRKALGLGEETPAG